MRAKGLCDHKHEPVCVSYRPMHWTWLHIDHHIQHQDMADALDCAHRQIPDSSSILADTHYYLDSTTLSSMIVDKVRNESVTR